MEKEKAMVQIEVQYDKDIEDQKKHASHIKKNTTKVECNRKR